MTLTLDDVRHLAVLSRLSLSDDELEHYLKELNAILHFVEQLQQVDVTDLEPTYQVTGLTNVMREDTIEDLGTPAEKLITPDRRHDGYIKVGRVL